MDDFDPLGPTDYGEPAESTPDDRPQNNLPATPTAPVTPATTTQHPLQIGPYEIVEALGEGGMGTVYLARQSEPVKREVALKLIRASISSPEIAARFSAERQAMARLSHANIAHMYEAGTTEEGFPFFAMEHVPGVSITAYCNRENLTISQRLDLFISICQGVQYAHQKGIIHRDIKPNNLLVTEVEGEPVAKVIDFGIAKALDGPLIDDLELTGERVIGTPAYMSPEALRLGPDGMDVDTRTDVYALGVLLYELLVEARPFETRGESMANLLVKIAEGEAQRPSTQLAATSADVRQAVARRRGLKPAELAKQLHGDLDWIVMNAIAKERDQRYGSAAELAADVSRYLDHVPVSARPPSAAYRVGKFVRRHRALVAALVFASVAVVAGATGVVINLVRAQRAEATAKQEATAAKQVSDFLVSLFIAERPGEMGGEAVTARELLDLGAKRLDSLGEQPLIRARLQRVVGLVYNELGLQEKAAPMLESAVAIHQRLLGADDLQTSKSLYELARLHQSQGRFDSAKTLLSESLTIREARLGGDDLEVADTLAVLGAVYVDLHLYDEAERCFLRATSIHERLLGPENRDLAVSLGALAVVYDQQGRYAEAQPLFRKVLDIRRRVLGDRHPQVADATNDLAVNCWYLEEYEQAEQLYQDALGIYVQALGPTHKQVAVMKCNLGELYWKQERLEEAANSLREAVTILEQRVDPGHPDVAYAAELLAGVCIEQGDAETAEALYRRALGINRAAFGPDHPATVATSEALAAMLRASGRIDEADLIDGLSPDHRTPATP